MQEYKDIVRRFDLIFKTSEEPLLVTRKEAEQLYELSLIHVYKRQI